MACEWPVDWISANTRISGICLKDTEYDIVKLKVKRVKNPGLNEQLV